jgi:flavin reductase ActVB
MTVQPRAALTVDAFAAAMARLVSGLAVVTTQAPDGQPAGLLVSSICSYSVRPPSVLVAIDQASRSYASLVGRDEFGVHLLGRAHKGVARVFASQSTAKFADLTWRWDGTVPQMADAPVYLRCATSQVFHHGDHAIVIGEVASVQARAGEPLVYYQRRLDWQLQPRLITG